MPSAPGARRSLSRGRRPLDGRIQQGSSAAVAAAGSSVSAAAPPAAENVGRVPGRAESPRIMDAADFVDLLPQVR